MEKGRTFRRNKCILKYNSANFRQIIINKQKKTSIKNDYNVRLDIGIESNGVYLYSDKLAFSAAARNRRKASFRCCPTALSGSCRTSSWYAFKKVSRKR